MRAGSDGLGELGRAKRLEVGLIGLRWFVAGFGILVTAASVGSTSARPGYALPLGFVLVACLALGNVLVSSLTERATGLRRLRLVGLSAFVLDLVVITGLVWTYATPGNSLWVLAYLLPLEGAVRYRVVGALIPVALNLVSEPLRELYVTVRYPLHHYLSTAVAFRLGVETAVAVVAGLMARSLRREADRSRERANVAEDAARREARARREVSAFHTAVLAGVSADGVGPGVRSMVASIARDLRLVSLGILLLEDDELVATGVAGAPGYPIGARLAVGAGLVGRVALERETHVEAVGPSSAEGEAAVPLTVGTELLGVLHVRTAGPISEDELRMLTALADQIAMVIQSALLRERQEETVHRLRELDEMKSDFVAITSHELRTPLAAIRGFVKTLQRRMHELSLDETQEFLGIVEQQTDRLIRLVEDLLVVSRIEAGKLSLEPQALDPDEFLPRVVTGLGNEAARVEIVTGDGLPELFVADPGRLGQVLANLLHNALKFSASDGRVLLRADVEAGDLALRVVDEGVGIAETELERIFERFHQTDSAATRKAEGAGLGLYITRKLVEAMGGRIEVVSEVGLGSTFTVRLPLGPVGGRARPSAATRAD